MRIGLGWLEAPAYNALRIVAGFLFTLHGLQKFGFFGGRTADFPSFRGAAGVIEAIAGPLLMAGFLTVPTAFVASGEMAVAYFRQHLPQGPWPIQNGGELAALYCFLFLFISARGPGAISLDAMMRRKKPSAARG
jgi:putative oxidoreductase